VAAEWDHGGYDGNADNATISETRVDAGDSSDAYDVDPDIENYAAGNSPETAYRNQGNPDGPNGWIRFVSEGAHEETGGGDYGDGADQHTELDETHGAGGAPDLWGDIHPDAANYPGLDGQGAAGPEAREGPDHRESEPDRDGGADTDQRISALEAKFEAKLADMKAEYDARFEEMRAESGQVRETASAHDQSDDKPAPWADQPKAQDAADATHAAIIAENKTSDEGMDRKESEGAHWRRAASAENVAIASGVAGVADTLAQFAMHASPEGVVGLGAAVLGLASLGLAKLEKKRTEKP
jgi:hypothetical protein